MFDALHAVLNYQDLKLIWWVLIGILFTGVMVMDGFCSGILTMVPLFSREDGERRLLINSVGSLWEGNQVWLILAGGALFAAWPMVYAIVCSTFYLAVFLLLLSLIMRPVGFKLRSKVDSNLWRGSCDLMLYLGGLLPPLLIGVVIGNLLIGVGFSFDTFLQPAFDGNILSKLNYFALLCGVLNVCFAIRQGAIYLCARSETVIAARAHRWFTFFNFVALILLTLVFCMIPYIKGYVLESFVEPNALPNPLGKSVQVVTGGWARRFFSSPWLVVFPVLCAISFFTSMLLMRMRKYLLAFFAGAISPLGFLCSIGAAMYPFFLPSSTKPNHSLLIWDSSSSYDTLIIMLLVVIIVLPCVLFYTSWVYRVFSFKLSVKTLSTDEAY